MNQGENIKCVRTVCRFFMGRSTFPCTLLEGLIISYMYGSCGHFIDLSGRWVLKLLRLRQTVRVGACFTIRIKIILKTVALQTRHVTHSEFKSQTSRDYPAPGAPCDWHRVFTKQSSHKIPESAEPGDTFLQSAFLSQFTILWWKPQSSNLPISCFKI